MALTQVKSDGIATGAVTATQIATNAVTVDDISDGSISTAKLADDSVTGDKLANTAVTAGTYGSSSAIPSLTVDAQGRITSASTNSVTQVGGATGVDFNDNVKARFGTGNDLEIHHNGTDSVLNNVTGNFYIQNVSDDQDITLRTDDGSGSVTNYIVCDGSEGDVQLHHYGTQKLATTSTGIDVTGTVTSDGVTSEGVVIAQGNAEYQIRVKDANSTGTATETGISFVDSSNTVQSYIGQVSSAVDDFYVRNTRTGGDIRFGTGNADRCRVTSSGHFVPESGNTYDLGDSTRRWRNVYTNDLNLSNEGGANDVDGTWGSWTIQEGEDDLFLLNRRNGKKYKFNLTEVN